MDRQTATWALGDGTQRRYADLLSGRGYLVVPTYGLNDGNPDKAPILVAHGRALVCPDALVLHRGKFAWHEVKAKSRPTWRRTHRRWEHGCDWFYATQYQLVQGASGSRVWIVVHEDKSPVDATADSELVPSDIWLTISLNRAFKFGERRPDWPGGVCNPQSRGKCGHGGLLWPRAAMSVLHLG